MQDIWPKGSRGVIIGRGMESCEWDGHDHPVLVGVDAVDENDDECHQQEEQEQVPALADLDEVFAEVMLYEIADCGRLREWPLIPTLSRCKSCGTTHVNYLRGSTR